MKADISLDVNVSDAGSNAFSGGPYWSAAMSFAMALADGTTAGKADLAYMAERTVATGANDDIDLAGVLTEALGTSFAAAEIVAIVILNSRKSGVANTTNLTIGAASSNPWVGLLNAAGTVGPLRPGAFFAVGASDAAGIGAVVAGTGDILRVANSAGASNTYQICILARTA